MDGGVRRDVDVRLAVGVLAHRQAVAHRTRDDGRGHVRHEALPRESCRRVPGRVIPSHAHAVGGSRREIEARKGVRGGGRVNVQVLRDHRQRRSLVAALASDLDQRHVVAGDCVVVGERFPRYSHRRDVVLHQRRQRGRLTEPGTHLRDVEPRDVRRSEVDERYRRRPLDRDEAGQRADVVRGGDGGRRRRAQASGRNGRDRGEHDGAALGLERDGVAVVGNVADADGSDVTADLERQRQLRAARHVAQRDDVRVDVRLSVLEAGPRHHHVRQLRGGNQGWRRRRARPLRAHVGDSIGVLRAGVHDARNRRCDVNVDAGGRGAAQACNVARDDVHGVNRAGDRCVDGDVVGRKVRPACVDERRLLRVVAGR
mmetsp:Transcript_1864/g.5921  ORF Transcript_1864/g.5921 Transcript_1864/m.5921 type:complete len:371 (-) Transcript_1864:2583-3695(-)